MTSSATYGLVVAANDETVRGPYSMQLANCPLSTLTFGDSQSGTLNGANCTVGDGAQRRLVLAARARECGALQCRDSRRCVRSFPLAGLLTDVLGDFPLTNVFTDDPSVMYPLGQDLALLMKVRGAAPADAGSYVVNVDVATLRQ